MLHLDKVATPWTVPQPRSSVWPRGTCSCCLDSHQHRSTRALQRHSTHQHRHGPPSPSPPSPSRTASTAVLRTPTRGSQQDSRASSERPTTHHGRPHAHGPNQDSIQQQQGTIALVHHQSQRARGVCYTRQVARLERPPDATPHLLTSPVPLFIARIRRRVLLL